MHSVANDCKPTYLARNLEVDSSVLVYLFNNVIKDSGSLEFSTQSSLAFDFDSDGPYRCCIPRLQSQWILGRKRKEGKKQ